jgi:hypothetical protein
MTGGWGRCSGLVVGTTQAHSDGGSNGECHRRREDIPMVRDEVVASLVIGVVMAFVLALVWGHQVAFLVAGEAW